MKKLPKILTAILTGLTMILSSVLAFGCGGKGGAGITFNEYSALVKSAATDFYSVHTEYETFQDITYRWTDHESNKETFTLEYKENATDEDTVSGSFLEQTVTDTTYTVAVKKGEGKLIGQFTVNSTTAVDTYEVKQDDTVEHVVSNTVESKTYRLVTVADEDPQNSPHNYLIYESSYKVDDEDAVVEKKYRALSESDYGNYMDGYMVKYPNKRIYHTFFELGEIFMVYSSMINVEKKDNKTALSVGYEFSQVEVGTAEYDIASISTLLKIVFDSGKVSKAETSNKQSTKDVEFEKSVVFDFVNSAAVDDNVDLTDFTEDNNWSFTDGFTDAIDDLPYTGFFN